MPLSRLAEVLAETYPDGAFEKVSAGAEAWSSLRCSFMSPRPLDPVSSHRCESGWTTKGGWGLAVPIRASVARRVAHTPQEFAFPRPRKNQKMILYDRDGKNLSKAADIAAQHGYKNVKNYEGAWQDWQDKEAKSQK